MSQNKEEENNELTEAKEKFENQIKAYNDAMDKFFKNDDISPEVRGNLGAPLARLLEEAKKISNKDQSRLDGLNKMSADLKNATEIISGMTEQSPSAEALKKLQAIKLDPNPKTPFEKALTVFKYAVGITLVLGVVGAALFFTGGLAAIPIIGFLGAGGPAMFAAGFGAAAGYATFAASTIAAGFMSVAAPSAFTIGIMGASVNALYLGVAAVVTGAVYLYRDKLFGKSQEVKNVERTGDEISNTLHQQNMSNQSRPDTSEKSHDHEIELTNINKENFDPLHQNSTNNTIPTTPVGPLDTKIKLGGPWIENEEQRNSTNTYEEQRNSTNTYKERLENATQNTPNSYKKQTRDNLDDIPEENPTIPKFK